MLSRPTPRVTLIAFSIIAVAGAPLRGQSRTPHALDPLSAGEIRQAVAVLGKSGRLSDQARFGTITVQPRGKSARESRAARVVGFDWKRNEGFLAIVDLESARLETFTVVDSEPPMRLLSIRRAEEIAHADPRWIAAMKARRIDTARVSVLVDLGERAKLPRRGADRVVNASVWLRDGIPDATALDGLRLQVNLTQRRLDAFEDSGKPPRMTDSAATKALASPRPPLPALRIEQPAGSSVRVVGNQITWDRWRFRVGVDPRLGLEIHDVAVSDGARWRSVLFSGSVSEIVAPYGDRSFGTWYPRDEGDYGMGIYSQSSAVLLNDVPANATFLPATMHDDRGRPTDVPRAIALYERDGGILWRHANQSRRARQLVVSGHSTIDNYDYQFNWIFNQDGAIEGEVVLSGIMNVNPTSRMRDTAHVSGHTVFGHLVAPGINAPNHQHFFSYRLDLDVDGAANTVYMVDTQAPTGDANPKGELFGMSEQPLATEGQAATDVSFRSARTWRVANTHETNTLGQFTGYTLVPGAVTPAFALARSAPVRTAGYIAHQLWVTPYAPNELYAAGEFQNLGRDGDGLPTWIAGNRSITDTDVVLWHTVGITHIPRPEDWPYMPAHRGSFRLVPTSFFPRNPTLDVPAQQR
jgi:primary-amine oxidase